MLLCLWLTGYLFDQNKVILGSQSTDCIRPFFGLRHTFGHRPKIEFKPWHWFREIEVSLTKCSGVWNFGESAFMSPQGKGETLKLLCLSENFICNKNITQICTHQRLDEALIRLATYILAITILSLLYLSHNFISYVQVP